MRPSHSRQWTCFSKLRLTTMLVAFLECPDAGSVAVSSTRLKILSRVKAATALPVQARASADLSDGSLASSRRPPSAGSSTC